MGFTRRLAVALICCIATFSAAIAQILPVITRDAEYHRSGGDVFRQPTPDTWGGVVMQATASLRGADGRSISGSDLLLRLERRDSTDGFCLIYNDDCYFIATSRSDLIAITRWIHSRATGAFSAFQLSDSVLKSAGLTAMHGASRGPYVAIEFRDTAIGPLLYEIDFNIFFDLASDQSDALQMWQKLSEGQRRTSGVGYWLVTDLDSNFVTRLEGGRVTFSGVPLRYDWARVTGSYVRVVRILPFLDGAQVSAALRDASGLSPLFEEASQFLELPRGMRDDMRQAIDRFLTALASSERRERSAVLRMQEYQDVARIRSRMADEHVTLFRKVALLRTIQIGNPGAWQAFTESVAREYASEIRERLEIERRF